MGLPLGALDAVLAAHRAGRPDEAERACRVLLRDHPGDPDLLHLLGVALHQQGRHREAVDWIGRAVSRLPSFPAFRVNRSQALRALGETEAAEEDLRRVLATAPDHVVALANLGDLLAGAGDPVRALLPLRRALERDPGFHPARTSLVKALVDLDAWEEALDAGAGAPDSPALLVNLAVAQTRLGRKLEARETLERALALFPATAYLHNNLGNVLRDLGDWPEALSHYRRALELDGSLFVAHSNVMFTRLFDPGATGAELAGEGRGWEARRGCLSPSLPPPVARDPEKRLRIGYVSPDFKEHAVAFFTEPLLRAHDRSVVEVVCYSGTPRPDRTTERLRSLADGWVETLKMGDGVLAERIRSDGIDILVDLAGHTHGNRLLALAARPAPVQVTAVLGYGGTTGLSWIGHVLTDGVLTPEGAEGQFTERVVRIPGAFAAFQPREEWAEAAPVPPGPPVFGCLSDPSRIDGEQLLWWRRLLEEVPGSRLLFKHGAYDSPRLESYWRSLFAAVSERSSFEGLAGGWGAHMGVYGRVSVVLDTWPVSGATSALIPLWMGVPVVAVAGGHAGQRFGAAVLTAAGLPELVAADGPGSVAIAAGLVRDGDRLRELRETLRGRLRASPLLDAGGHARAMEAAFRGLWREACARETGEENGGKPG
ncbi:MAG: tetratricopeptide repeat protein [Alphaproteobacteria bacterium]|nr:tetratricopeptide repeat protein [Alphaproteobacteria bacterium]